MQLLTPRWIFLTFKSEFRIVASTSDVQFFLELFWIRGNHASRHCGGGNVQNAENIFSYANVVTGDMCTVVGPVPVRHDESNVGNIASAIVKVMKVLIPPLRMRV